MQFLAGLFTKSLHMSFEVKKHGSTFNKRFSITYVLGKTNIVGFANSEASETLFPFWDWVSKMSPIFCS